MQKLEIFMDKQQHSKLIGNFTSNAVELMKIWTPFGEYLMDMLTQENTLLLNDPFPPKGLRVHSSTPPWVFGDIAFQFKLQDKMINKIIKPNFANKSEGLVYGKLFSCSKAFGGEDELPMRINKTGFIFNSSTEKKENVRSLEII
ncbi:unnamed protein product [Allacma fusca]|uniref:Uncharacterized protein n=1 Tax=Allacma fusca TaxID=39272 RepID=A0A8J2PH94_9HEXA|nr:unnamed protein product [Allacma fusca]